MKRIPKFSPEILTGGGMPAKNKLAPPMRGGAQPLISVGDLEGMFNDSVIATLAADRQVPTHARSRFAQSVRLDARLFLEAKVRLNNQALRVGIERLYQLITRAEQRQ